MIFNEQFFIKIIEDMLEMIKQQVYVIVFYQFSWMIAIQYIYYELNINYYDIINDQFKTGKKKV